MRKQRTADHRLRTLALIFFILAVWIIVRLFTLQVLSHDYYTVFAFNNHEISRQLRPSRGEIFFSDSRTGQEYPAAINKEFYLVFAVPTEIPSSQASSTASVLSEVLGIPDLEWQNDLKNKLLKSNDPYETVKKKVTAELVAALRERKLPGIYFTPQEYRFYPEERLAAATLGFVGEATDGVAAGRYGIEGYFDKELKGSGGFVAGERGASGSWISLGSRTFTAPHNGADVVLTIDRTLQHKACERLRQGLIEFKAESAALVLMNPKTGAILALCSLPDFDPNDYASVKDISWFNNAAVFTPYEPGSVFKPITMAGALDADVVKPETTFDDPCQRVINKHTIKNALQKCYGLRTMTEVLENSINTGMIFVEERLGRERFKSYLEKFAFGKKLGVTINTEAAGNITSLDNPAPIYAAVGSFGQGLTVTPLQLAAAYSAIAADGVLPRPFIIKEIRQPNGAREVTRPEALEEVISPRAAKLLRGMLTSVVKNGGSYHSARLPDYYLAGKTGTAQIPGRGGYTEETNHTFSGFGPSNDPQFVLIVKYEKPQRRWAESTAAPVFRDVMKFALDYYGVPKDK